MNNPLHILETLDSFLSEKVELTLYGRGAIALGFCPEEPYAVTMDIDLIIPEIELSSMDANEDFWQAIEKTNLSLSEIGLYLTHIFIEGQVILSSDWLETRRRVEIPSLQNIDVYLPSTCDLILTKMMRVDPQDREDIQFLRKRVLMPREEWLTFFKSAKVPDIKEIQEAFLVNQKWFIDEVLG